MWRRFREIGSAVSPRRRSLGLPLARHDPLSKLSVPELYETLSTDKLWIMGQDKRGSLFNRFKPRINSIALLDFISKQDVFAT